MIITTQMEQRIREVLHKIVSKKLPVHAGPSPARYGNVQRVDGGFFADIPLFISDKEMEKAGWK